MGTLTCDSCLAGRNLLAIGIRGPRAPISWCLRPASCTFQRAQRGQCPGARSAVLCAFDGHNIWQLPRPGPQPTWDTDNDCSQSCTQAQGNRLGRGREAGGACRFPLYWTAARAVLKIQASCCAVQREHNEAVWAMTRTIAQHKPPRATVGRTGFLGTPMSTMSCHSKAPVLSSHAAALTRPSARSCASMSSSSAGAC